LFFFIFYMIDSCFKHNKLFNKYNFIWIRHQ
jgi:hypothetical protein